MKQLLSVSVISIFLSGCMMPPPSPQSTALPALEYTRAVQRMKQTPTRSAAYRPEAPRVDYNAFSSPDVRPANQRDSRAQLRFVDGGDIPEMDGGSQGALIDNANAVGDGGFHMERASAPTTRDYSGPLQLGEPGVASSLWEESRGGNDLFHDHRAWQPLDLVTIIVTELAEGRREADTEIKSQSNVQAAIQSLLGFEQEVVAKNPNVRPEALIQARTINDYKGEGETNRRGILRGRISGMVVEVLPGGILRIEGEKIVSVNKDEEIMRISGLVRPRDITALNEVDSNKIANMRIDYFGKGEIAESQSGGFGARIMRNVWPF